MSSVNLVTLTPSQLRAQDENESIWVVNGTMRNPKDRANVVVLLPMANGEAQEPLAIFASWVPINVTDKIPRKQLLAARNFLKALEMRRIIAIPESEALRLLEMPGAAEECERVRMMDISTATGDAMGSIGEETTVPIQIDNGNQQAEDPVSASVYQFIGLMGDATGMEALNSLRNLGDLNVEEYQAILKEARGLGESHKDVIGHCRMKLAGLTGQDPIAAGGMVRRV